MNRFRFLLVALLMAIAIPIKFDPDSSGAASHDGADGRNAAAPATADAPNRFDPGRLKPGDRVAGMEIVRIDMTRSEFEYLGTAQFRGSALLKGRYAYSRSNETFGEILAFHVDEDSRDRLPTLPNDTREPWFVFTNHAEALRLFGIPEDADEVSGEAAVVIDEYFVHYDYKEVYNTARLIEAYVPAARP